MGARAGGSCSCFLFVPLLLLLLLELAALTGALAPLPSTPACLLSEYFCDNGRCVPLSRYCDAVNDCGDASDEPRGCTPCNRTYYGSVGRTYSLELHRPKDDRVPYLCHLTFTAGGSDYGDLVQLTFESFTLGRFVSFTSAGCPDGSMSISESGRPSVGGAWCGQAWGPAVYFSETRSVLVTVRLLRLNKESYGYNFDFRLGYRMLPRNSAVVRYGGKPPHNLFWPLMPVGRGENASAPESNMIPGMGGVIGGLDEEQPSTPPRTVVAPNEEQQHYLGDLITGTYCSRLFSDCDRKPCRLQSPNFPGVYPRNLTCYYAVRQHEVPPGQHALITVSQPDGQLLAVRSVAPKRGGSGDTGQGGSKGGVAGGAGGSAPAGGGVAGPVGGKEDEGGVSIAAEAGCGPSGRQGLKVWQECDEVQDYVTVYDGYTTRDPVLLRFCGSGQPVPPVTSSGPEVLVEFSTSPFGCLEQPGPLQALHGFQLEVQVQFVDARSPTYSKGKRCEMWVRGNGSGQLESPRHSLPRNATCLFHLQGAVLAEGEVSSAHEPPPRFPIAPWSSKISLPPPRFRVWLSVLKFHVTTGLDPTPTPQILKEEEGCASQLRVWDGSAPLNSDGSPVPSLGNTSLLARYCKDKVPRSCDHGLLPRRPRPCSLAESFLSSGDSLTLELRTSESSALRPVNFRALYEFVDLQQDGEPYGSGPCSRRFLAPPGGHPMGQPQEFQSPRDVFLFGRGGSTNLTCKFRFEALPGEQVSVTLTRLHAGERQCRTRNVPELGRLYCHGDNSVTITIFEEAWPGRTLLPRDCFCSDELLPYTFKSVASVVEVHLSAMNMNATDDFRRIMVSGVWTSVRETPCARHRKLTGPSGSIQLMSGVTGRPTSCDGMPWIVEPAPGRYLFVTARGVALHPNDTASCATKNRIILHAGVAVHLLVCPEPVSASSRDIVQVVSEGWVVSAEPPFSSRAHASRSVVVELVGKEPATYSVNWLELSRRPLEPPSVGVTLEALELCQHRCPELDACINATLWCDGVSHCPSGYDEAATHCWLLLQLPLVHLLIGAACLGASVTALCVMVAKVGRRRRRRRDSLQRRLQDAPSLDSKEVIC